MAKKNEQVKETPQSKKAPMYAPFAKAIEHWLGELERSTKDLMELPRVPEGDEIELRRMASVSNSTEPDEEIRIPNTPSTTPLIDPQKLAKLRSQHPIEIANEQKRRRNTSARLELHQAVENFRRRLTSDITNPLAEPTLDRIQRYTPTLEAQAQTMIDVAESLDNAPVVNNPAPRQTTAGNGAPARGTQIPGYDKAY